MADNPVIKFMPVNINISDINRFWSKVAFTANPNCCWEWTGGVLKQEKPYGIFSLASKRYFNTKAYSSHRMAYYLHYKKDPAELCVLHTCDNPRCVNPAHLFLGTNDDNVADKMLKGRHKAVPIGYKRKEEEKRPGSLNNAAKLTEEKVLTIRELYKNEGLSKYRLSKMYDVSEKVIYNVIERKSWTHI